MSAILSSVLPEDIARLLEDPQVTDVCVNSPDTVFADRGFGLERTPRASSWAASEALRFLTDSLARAGKSWDARQPFLDLRLPSGHRLHAILPPIAADFPLISIRRLSSASGSASGEAARDTRWSHDPAWRFLCARVRAGDSVLVAGATGAGKTTLLNDLISSVPPEERIVALEDTPELCPEHPHFLSLQSRNANADGFGEISLRSLLRQTLRMRPDRILIGECRGGEILELLQALNTGHRGALATVHACGERDALRRIELLCLLHGPAGLSPALVRELLAQGLHWVAHLSRDPRSGERRISLSRLEGREGDTILLRKLVDFRT